MTETPSYATSVVRVLRKHFLDLGTETSHLAVDAITRQANDPQPGFEFIVDDPWLARWRLKPDGRDRHRVRLAYFPVMPPGSDANNELERTVNEALSRILPIEES